MTGEGFVVDLEELGGVFGLGAGGGEDAGDEVAVEADFFHWEGFDGYGVEAFDGGGDAEGGGPFGKIGAGVDACYAGAGAGGGGVDGEDSGVGVGGADEAGVEGTGEDDVVEVAGLAFQEAGIFAAAEGEADGVCHAKRFRPEGSKRWRRAGSMVKAAVWPSV